MMRRIRTDLQKDEFEASASGVERELRSVVPAEIPAGLRERVLDRAAATRQGAALTPWMRVAAIACTVLVVSLLALDPLLSRHEEARLAALLDGRSMSTAALDTAAELADAVIGTEAVLWSRLQGLAAAASRKPPAGGNLVTLERLKGWWEYENPEDPY